MHKLYLAQYWEAPAPDTYFVANGLSGMGWALPSALGFKLTSPETPALAVTGDGGALMFAGELGTLARCDRLASSTWCSLMRRLR